ncbi:MAG: molybdate ABC transporter substrate-binding protein [Candidatus Altiarchaeales archaeon A3]|nr:MAG: molybdate ABC transporter substrate-binding protein [Candidatus Altiarchaeales archaeon A3]
MKNKIFISGACVFLTCIILLSGCVEEKKETENKTIMVFAGAASMPAMKEAASIFEEKYNITVELNFGSSGTVLSQMEISKQGDIYIPGSNDFMDKAKEKRIIEEDTEKILAYLLPAIVVQKGNPKNISSLDELVYKVAHKNVTLAICNPVSCCVGLYAAEIFDKNNVTTKIKEKIITYAKSCSDTESLIVLKKADAVIGWDAFGTWHPDDADIVYLNSSQIPRIAYIPAAVTKFSKNKESSQKFIDFLTSEDGKKIFKKWGYITKENEIKKYAPHAKIGESYNLSNIWYK